jgi:23S rRNA (pseudouridine1915-N3)-methyltransferase
MEIIVAAVGRMKAGPFRVLWDDYAKRMGWDLTLREVEEKRPLASAELKLREAELLRKAIPEGAHVVALDAQGRTLDSPAFAARIKGWQESSGGPIAFVIGGADGLDGKLVKDAAFVLALGAMTWPHMLARVMLIEQIYRAQCILTNHPYHR